MTDEGPLPPVIEPGPVPPDVVSAMEAQPWRDGAGRTMTLGNLGSYQMDSNNAGDGDHLRRILSSAGPSLGTSLNFLYGPATPAEVAAAYDGGDHRRLVELKARYDPENTFRANHNLGRPGPR